LHLKRKKYKILKENHSSNKLFIALWVIAWDGKKLKHVKQVFVDKTEQYALWST